MPDHAPPTLDDIRKLRAELADRDRVLAEIEASLIDAAAKWSILSHVHVPALPVTGAAHAPSVETTTPRAMMQGRKKTKNDLIIEALHAPRPLWQTANEIQRHMSAATGKNVPMSSVSPALTALKKAEAIVRKDLFVALALRVESEEPGFLNENGEAVASPDAGQDANPAQNPTPSLPSA